MSCFSDRRQAAEKQAEKAGRAISTLKAALASKEAELHKQHKELVRLRHAEDAHARAEAVEGKRLRALADSLVCKLTFLHLTCCVFYLPVMKLICLMQLL